MTIQHTPGPWTVQDFNADDLQSPSRFEGPVVVYAESDCDIHPVADCSCNHTCRAADEAQANARLIAAAPDLLEAASALLADVRRRYPGEELRCPFMRALDAAMTKATGEPAAAGRGEP